MINLYLITKIYYIIKANIIIEPVPCWPSTKRKEILNFIIYDFNKIH